MLTPKNLSRLILMALRNNNMKMSLVLSNKRQIRTYKITTLVKVFSWSLHLVQNSLELEMTDLTLILILRKIVHISKNIN